MATSKKTDEPFNKSQMVRLVVIAGGVGFLALVAPIILAAAQAGLGLLAIGGMGVVGMGMARALPLLGQKWENKLLALRKKEAEGSPIEQMQNSLRRRSDLLKQFLEALRDIKTQVDGMKDMLEERRRAKPSGDYSPQETALKKMYAYYETGVQRAKRGNEELEKYKDLIQDKIFQWEFAQAGQKALAAMNPLDQKNILDSILSDAAVKSVQQSFNSVFAEIDLDVQTLSNGRALEFDGGMTIDVSNIQIDRVQPISIK